MEKKKVRFTEATLSKMERDFGLIPDLNMQLPSFLNWQAEAATQKINDYEKRILSHLQRTLRIGVAGWNEVELESKFIAPLFSFANFDDGRISYFMERSLKAEINGVELFGNVDGIIARGRQEPELPLFCMQEFKRSQDNSGRADGQALAAMLVAQALNENKLPVYGLFIVGVSWNFMVLEDKTYTVSETYSADGKGVYEIFKLLKALKVLILKEI